MKLKLTKSFKKDGIVRVNRTMTEDARTSMMPKPRHAPKEYEVAKIQKQQFVKLLTHLKQIKVKKHKVGYDTWNAGRTYNPYENSYSDSPMKSTMNHSLTRSHHVMRDQRVSNYKEIMRKMQVRDTTPNLLANSPHLRLSQ